MTTTQPIINAMITTFLAIGMAVGEDTLQRAGQLLREFLAEDVADGQTADILDSLLVGIGHSEAPSPMSFLDQLVLAA